MWRELYYTRQYIFVAKEIPLPPPPNTPIDFFPFIQIYLFYNLFLLH